MPRRLLSEAEIAAMQVEELVGKKRKRRVGPSPERARTEIRTMLADNDFVDARPTHLVALYDWCHEQVYGVRPAELEQGETWKHATFAAARLVATEFKGEMAEAIEFIRWTWRRERYRETRRRAGTWNSVGRIGWRLQFVQRHLVTDYRIDLARST